jgi:hypothetical protein
VRPRPDRLADRHYARIRERASKLREDRQVGVTGYAVKPTDAQRQHRSLVLEASGLALDSATTGVELRGARRVARDQRMQTGPPSSIDDGLSAASAPVALRQLLEGVVDRRQDVEADEMDERGDAVLPADLLA